MLVIHQGQPCSSWRAKDRWTGGRKPCRRTASLRVCRRLSVAWDRLVCTSLVQGLDLRQVLAPEAKRRSEKAGRWPPDVRAGILSESTPRSSWSWRRLTQSGTCWSSTGRKRPEPFCSRSWRWFRPIYCTWFCRRRIMWPVTAEVWIECSSRLICPWPSLRRTTADGRRWLQLSVGCFWRGICSITFISCLPTADLMIWRWCCWRRLCRSLGCMSSELFLLCCSCKPLPCGSFLLQWTSWWWLSCAISSTCWTTSLCSPLQGERTTQQRFAAAAR